MLVHGTSVCTGRGPRRGRELGTKGGGALRQTGPWRFYIHHTCVCSDLVLMDFDGATRAPHTTTCAHCAGIAPLISNPQANSSISNRQQRFLVPSQRDKTLVSVVIDVTHRTWPMASKKPARSGPSNMNRKSSTRPPSPPCGVSSEGQAGCVSTHHGWVSHGGAGL